MIDRHALLEDLRRLMPALERDILTHNESTGGAARLKDEYREAQEANRTAEAFVDWQGAQVTQAAAAWLLTCVFVRFLEDNDLLDEVKLAGPAGPRLQHAKDRIEVHFREQPRDAERAYLLSVFDSVMRLPAVAELLDQRHNPLWQMPVSDDGARSIVDFFQRVDPETGEIVHDFTDPDWDTRFLGDLYQDLSETVRKRYALLQTPEFVESFILDYTLEPARETFGLPGLRLIDPTCGSGHFLLTAFERLFNAWSKREPATNSRHLAQRALDAVHGVDINPYAIAIARFRLLIAAMRAAGSTRMKDAPDFQFHLAVGDSLYHGRRHEWSGQGVQQDAYESIQHVQDTEDRDKLEQILGQCYHVVVGNPPYITVKDKALNQAYRDKYLTCHRQYSLGVPFTERFFDLTLPAEGNRPAGYVGMITTNSFMKREFGKKLIEEYLPKKNLTHVIDTSGAYIPGHGTPTVILFARNETPTSDFVRAALGIRGEPKTPDVAAMGRVWRSIVEMLEKPGAENDFVTVVDSPRTLYGVHPWSVGGGGATELKDLIDSRA
ncbi:MAG: BREX-2 system adenine-specific DNA-methyltransferase PglX, partial [Roseibium sp.]|nr:BREX-2 system adenine-specific DNA-methyltransferase PglX [Roseibium sp.]